jgi:Uma2 family endonuclease
MERLPDHTQLPHEDGIPVKNFLEHPQSILLTDSIGPVLALLHPDGNWAIGHDSAIYWRVTDPPLDGARAPDWFYVPDVPPKLGGTYRRSYVLWQELVAPLIILEFVSGDGSEERDRTPWKGKFWVYERVVRAPYYGIFEGESGRLEMHELTRGTYVLMEANSNGRYRIPPLGVELGVWRGSYQNFEGTWLRWWDTTGKLLPTGAERAEQERARAEQERARAEQERARAEQERARAEQERMRAERLAARLRELGVEPDNGTAAPQ